MALTDATHLVSTEWLNAHLDHADIRILDATWFLPGDDRDPKALFAAEHIPGARYFDIDDVSDHRSSLPHMLPPVEKFLSRVRKMGVGEGHTIVVYDAQGLFSAARVWWMFKYFGHDRVAVLDGGLPKWKADGYAVTDAPTVIRDRHMYATPNPDMVRDVTQVAHATKLQDHTIIDARAAARFRGETVEPRPGLRSGHIPTSRNVPFQTVLNDDGTLKSPDDLKAVFTAAGVDLTKPAITTCGSGVTAAVLSLALNVTGKTDHSLYDGSWAEWGQFPTLAIETGDS